MRFNKSSKHAVGLVVFLATIIVLVLLKNPSAQESTPGHNSARELKVLIEPSSTKVLPYEPLRTVIRLKNGSLLPLEVNESWQIFRYLYNDDTGKWEIYYPSNIPTSFPTPPSPKTFLPGESKTWTTYFDFNAHRGGEHVFAQPGNVTLMVSVGQIKSEPLDIIVIEPQAEDAEAYEFLEQNNLFKHFANDFSNRYAYDEQTIEMLKTFILRFPNSKYIEYAQPVLSQMRTHGAKE